MPLVLANRVQETTTTTGTGTITLAGAVSGYQSFAAIGNGNTTFYTITSGTDWEVGLGTYTSAGTTLSRDTVLSSSAGGTTKITLSGTSTVFADYPAERAVTYESTSGTNIAANNIDYGYQTVVTAAGTTTLTVASPYYIYFTGVTTQIVVMPVTSTLALGWSYHITNNSSGNITVRSSGGNTITTIISGTTLHITCIDTTVTTAAGWDFGFTDFGAVTGTGSAVLSGSPTLTGTVQAAGITASGSISTSGALQTTSTASVSLTSTGAISIGSVLSTNQIQIGQASGTQTLNLHTGATSSGNTKTLNIGTGGLAGSTTTITIGSTAGTSTTTLNGAVSIASTIAAPLGSAAAPSYTFTGDTNTGIFSPGADTIAFAEGGAEVMRIDSSGNVGIGTSSPGSKLDLSGSSRLFFDVANAYTIQTARNPANSAFADFYVSGANYYVQTGGSNRMAIDSSGNVGIGTSSPGVKFQITQDQAAYSYFDYYNVTNGGGIVWRQIVRNIANSGTTSVDFAKLLGGGFALNNNDTNAANFTALGVGGSERMRIDSSGNVGIGTSSPSDTLTVVGGTSSWQANLKYAGTTQYQGAYLGLTCSSASSNYGQTVLAHAFDVGAGDTTATSFSIQQRTTGSSYVNPVYTVNYKAQIQQWYTSGSERMRIDSSGNVGIGTSSPGQKLDVTTAGGDDGIVLNNSSTTGGRVRLNSTGTGGRNYHITSTANGSGDGGGKFIIRDNTASDAARFTIDSSGNVGIGTSSPSKKLEVGALGAFRLQTGSSTLDCTPTAGATDGFIWNTSASCYYDWSSSGSTRMRINAAGIVSINGVVDTDGGSIVGSGAIRVQANSGYCHSTWSNANYTAVQFVQTASQVGTIFCTSTSTAYNTSSDARMKHDIVDAPEASSLIDALRVRSFKWNADNSEQRYGFVAQELLEVAPEAVHQPENPDEMMGVDYSKMVPMLIKEIQSLRARVAQLEGN